MRGGHFLLRGAVCLAIAAGASGASAAGSKPLGASYFFGSNLAEIMHSTATIAGQPFHGTEVILFADAGGTPTSISFNARTLSGYNAVTFMLGCADDANTDVGAKAVLQVLGDGQAPLGKYAVAQGQPARQAIVPFKGHGTLAFVAQGGSARCDVTLANPLAIVLRGSGSGAPTGSATLTVTPARVAAGAQETVSASAPLGTQATAVVTYASGQQQIVGPALVGSTGRATFRFIVAQGASGTARVTVVTAAKALQATFTITG